MWNPCCDGKRKTDQREKRDRKRYCTGKWERRTEERSRKWAWSRESHARRVSRRGAEATHNIRQSLSHLVTHSHSQLVTAHHRFRPHELLFTASSLVTFRYLRTRISIVVDQNDYSLYSSSFVRLFVHLNIALQNMKYQRLTNKWQ